MWKGVKRNVERQNNNENQYGRNRRKDKRKKLFFYRAACAMLGLLIVCVIFGAVYFLRESKDPVLPSKENTKTGKDYSFLADGQSEDESPISEPAISNRANAIDLNIIAANAIVMNKDTDALLYQKNGTDRIAPASTAKMITALTVLEYCSPEEEMRVGAEIEMIHSDSSTAWLMKGDTLTVRQLLIALMLPSGNDAAYTLAVNTGKVIAGDNSLSNQQAIQIFMDKVNEKARAIGVTRILWFRMGMMPRGSIPRPMILPSLQRHVWRIPLFQKLWRAIRRMKNGRTAGRSLTTIPMSFLIRTVPITVRRSSD